MATIAKGIYKFSAGKPGPKLRQEAAGVLRVAAEHRFTEEINGDALFIINDCTKNGHPGFRKALADFLTEEYEDKVDSEDLFVTAGATQGLHIALTLLVEPGSPVFMEEPTYFYATGIVKECSMKGVPVMMDADGILMDDLERKVSEATNNRNFDPTRSDKPFMGVIYVIPVFQNPSGKCYTPDRCRELVKFARKHNLLILCEDVYNLLYYDGQSPMRLFHYDNRHDVDYQGNVISNGSFSKILGAGIRLGWYEAPQRIMKLVVNSCLVGSGGPMNQLGSGLILSALKLGLQQTYLHHLREVYGNRMNTYCRFLQGNLPTGCTFRPPPGGYFIWIELPSCIDNRLIVEKLKSEYCCEVRDGRIFSQVGGFSNCMRLSVAYIEDEQSIPALTALCDCIRKYLPQSRK